jgi:hypothetical protein
MSPSPAPREFVSEVAIFVEGTDDADAIGALLRSLEISADIRTYDGVGNLSAFLQAASATAGFSEVKAVAIVRDTDRRPASTFQSTQDALRKANLAVPPKPDELAGADPAVMVILIPDFQTPGALEDLLLRTISADPVMPCVDSFFRCVDAVGEHHATERSKARVYARIAASKDARRTAGKAVGSIFPVQHEAFAPLRATLEALARSAAGGSEGDLNPAE